MNGSYGRCAIAAIWLTPDISDRIPETERLGASEEIALHNLLDQLGWSSFRDKHPSISSPARVVGIERGQARVLGEMGPQNINLRPKDPSLTVGDWVRVQQERIAERVPRRTWLQRKGPGGIQWLAANIDVAFVVTSANRDFNVRRLERYLAMIAQGGARPVIVLNKADLEAPQRFLEQLPQDLQVPVISLSAQFDETLAPLETYFHTGTTAIFVGSSGVGKSTLVNRLLGRSHQKTGAIREDDARGRHTTTRRSLILRPQGQGVVIDSPGLRALGLSQDIDPSAIFSQVDQLAQQCRFSDCAHETEPGCAIRAAIREGALDPARAEHYAKLRREREHERLREDALARKRKNRKTAAMIKEAKANSKRKRKGW